MEPCKDIQNKRAIQSSNLKKHADNNMTCNILVLFLFAGYNIEVIHYI
jgi:hypothetical protein